MHNFYKIKKKLIVELKKIKKCLTFNIYENGIS